jgi:xanthine phosphoribosyltransferase
MKSLQDRIVRDGKVLSTSVIKVDSFLNHQVDPALILDIGQTFAHEFKSAGITKVVTVEASGIHLAFATAAVLGVPFVYAKKKQAVTQSEGVYAASIFSYTRQETYQITVTKAYLTNSDRVLIIDDILAEGNALLGLLDILHEAQAQVVGVGIAIEKTFQNGRRKLEEAGVRIHALARIRSMDNGEVSFLRETERNQVEV